MDVLKLSSRGSLFLNVW